jgi:predicted alpha/beta hydrolase family esterase
MVQNRMNAEFSPMPERAFIIHGYQGYPGEAWQPWLKAELGKRGYDVALPEMPHADHPTIPGWIAFITGLVGRPDGKTVMIGHSLGAQAVMRYLETLGGAGQAVGKTVLIACNFPTGMTPEAADETTGGDVVLRPWLTVGVDPEKVKKAMGRCTVILSDNDPYVPFEEAKASFQKCIGVPIVVVTGKGHFNEDDKITELPEALAAVCS